MNCKRVFLDGEYKNKILSSIISIKKIFIIMLLIFSVLFFNAFFAYGFSITEIKYSPVINESEYINISFKTDIQDNVTYQIYKDGLLVSNTNYYEEKTDYASSGIYDFSILAMKNNSTIISNVTIAVLDVPLLINILEPENKSYNKVNISIKVQTNHDSNTQCRYLVSNIENTLSLFSSIKNMRVFQGNVILRDGSYEMEIFCEDEFESTSKKIAFSIYDTNIFISSKSYSITQENFINLNLETSSEAECRHSLYNKTFYEMTPFSITNSLIHKSIITDIPEGGYKLYLACKGNSGAIIYDSIVILLSTHPSAEILINKQGPLKQGTYEITLKTSKNVQNTPILNFILANDDTPRKILLTGSGQLWKGYLFIEEGMGETVGIFKFSAKDYNDVEGNIITSGEMFLIDTVKPLQPNNIRVEIDKNSNIRILWDYDGEDIPEFNVYRRLENNEREKIGKTKEKKFIDKTAMLGEKYFYSVSASDDAGNEGPISEEYEVQIQQSELQEASAPKVLDSSLVYLVDEKIRETEKILIDVNSAKDRINNIKDPDILKIINILGLDQKAEDASNEIENIISNLKDLKNQDFQKSELELRLNSLKMNAIKAQGKIVEEIIIDEKGSFEQVLQESDVESAVMYFLEGKNLTKTQLREYLLRNKILQDSVIVKTEALSFRIRNLNQENYDKKTLIEKKIIVSNNLENVSVVEIIPKEVENTASEISFFSIDYPYIIKDDPVVKWNFDSLKSLEYQYIINEKVSIVSLKNIKTVILEKPLFKISLERQKITGLAIFSGIPKISSTSWMIIVGIIIIIILASYYFSLDAQKNTISGGGINVKSFVLRKGGVKNNYNKNFERQKQTAKDNHSINSVNSAILSEKTKSDKNSITSKRISGGLSENLVRENIGIQEVLNGIDICNFHINSFNYDKAREIYNEFIYKITPHMDLLDDDEKDELLGKVNYLKDKIEIYRKIHLARRHLYFKKFKEFSDLINDINKHYSNMAYSIGFSNHKDLPSELKYLNFVAENIKSLKKHHERLRGLKK